MWYARPMRVDTMRESKDAQRRAMMAYKQFEREARLDALAGNKAPKIVTGSLKPYPREETGIIGNETLPLSTELRADVHQFYQESMTHARESGHLAYALAQAP